MEVAFVALTESCTFLLDAEGICRFSVLRPEADKTTREAAKRCLGAQYVASIDLTAEGLLVHEPKAGRSLLFARVGDTGRVALVRSGPLLEFQVLDPPRDVEHLGPPKSAHGLASDRPEPSVDTLEADAEEQDVEDQGALTEDFAEVMQAEAVAALDALENTRELDAEPPATDQETEEDRIDLPLSEEIKLALDRLDDIPAIEGSVPLDFDLRAAQARLDDEVTVERPSARPPPLSTSLLDDPIFARVEPEASVIIDEQIGEEPIGDEQIIDEQDADAQTAEVPSVRPPPSPLSLASRGLPDRPSSPESPEKILAKVLLDDDVGEELETLLVLDQYTEVETRENTDETTRFARHIPIAPGSEPITMKAPVTMKGFPPPARSPLSPRRGLLPKITR